MHSNPPFLVDSHCHLDALNYDERTLDDVLDAAQTAGVGHLLSVATTLSGYQAMATQYQDKPMISLSCGVHPLNLEDEPFDADRLEALAQSPKVVALGETGLDFYYQKENLRAQESAFAHHIAISNALRKPLIVHTRDAGQETVGLLKSEKAQAGVIHCFTETQAIAKAVLDLGFYISLSGVLTFKNAEALREVARYVPIDRLLVETDAPYLAPVPYRGKENQPAYVTETARYLATIKGITIEALAQQTTQNFSDLFVVSFSTSQM